MTKLRWVLFLVTVFTCELYFCFFFFGEYIVSCNLYAHFKLLTAWCYGFVKCNVWFIYILLDVTALDYIQ